ncbi:hypothetical protein PFISCL1PPCAC_19992, partial [Pristionchus fissidentatus]
FREVVSAMDGYNDDDFDYSLSDSDNESQGMSDDDGIAMEQEDHNPPKDPATDCTILNQDSLQKDMNDLIREVSQIVQISNGAIRILLNHFKWNKESLLERFYECSNVDEFLRSARVVADPSKMGDGVDGETMECTICCSLTMLTGLNCYHYACKVCWEKYLTTKVLVDNTSIIECLYPGCKLLVDDEHVVSLIGSNESARKAFTRLTINGFVESNRLLRWCPAADCGKAIKVSHCEPRVVQCECKCRFCFECGHEWHEPVNCRLLKLWLKKCSDDSETSNWINANTKECPKCHVTIEKDGGCNHMTCKNTACRSEFCWMCLGPWEPHGSSWYSCNRFDDSQAKQARDAQEHSRAALQRYLHYYNRFMNHQQSLRLESKLYTSVKVKMDLMQKNSMSWIEVQFLRKAVDILSECRRTLMYTYAFAYYLKRTNESEIFEDNQKDLELATEQLSEFLERDLESENLVTLKQKVQDKYRYVEQRRSVLLKHCAEGVEKDSWQFNQ